MQQKKVGMLQLTMPRDAEAAKKVSNQVNAFGRRSITIKGDMTSEDDILNMFEQVESELGHIKGLVNSAGTTGKTARVENMTALAIRQILELNVVGLICVVEKL